MYKVSGHLEEIVASQQRRVLVDYGSNSWIGRKSLQGRKRPSRVADARRQALAIDDGEVAVHVSRPTTLGETRDRRRRLLPPQPGEGVRMEVEVGQPGALEEVGVPVESFVLQHALAE